MCACCHKSVFSLFYSKKYMDQNVFFCYMQLHILNITVCTPMNLSAYCCPYYIVLVLIKVDMMPILIRGKCLQQQHTCA